MNWKIYLTGPPTIMEFLVNASPSEGIRIEPDGSQFRLAAPDFTDEPQASQDEIASVMRLINGAMALRFPGQESIKVSSRIREGDNGASSTVILPAAIVATSFLASPSFVMGNSDGTLPPPPNHGDSILKLAELGRADEDVAAVLRFLEHGAMNWRELYFVREVIADDVGGTGPILSSDWISSSNLTLFDRTANNRRAIGDEARHGHTRWDPPLVPMSLGEAQRHILGLVERWMNHKLRNWNEASK